MLYCITSVSMDQHASLLIRKWANLQTCKKKVEHAPVTPLSLSLSHFQRLQWITSPFPLPGLIKNTVSDPIVLPTIHPPMAAMELYLRSLVSGMTTSSLMCWRTRWSIAAFIKHWSSLEYWNENTFITSRLLLTFLPRFRYFPNNLVLKRSFTEINCAYVCPAKQILRARILELFLNCFDSFIKGKVQN